MNANLTVEIHLDDGVDIEYPFVSNCSYAGDEDIVTEFEHEMQTATQYIKARLIKLYGRN